MSRLLFAAARGARIQYQYLGDVWLSDTVIVLEPTSVQRRIHPDDEHLMWGPISSALRDMAKTTKRPTEDTYWRMARDYYLCNMPDHVWFDDDRPMLHYSLFLLILAEALADEGM